MWSKSPLEWGEILQGKTSNGSSSAFHAKPEDYQRWVNMFAKSAAAEMLLSATESATDFFRMETDLALLIPPQERNEAFYSMKLGYCVPGVPAQFLYFSQRIYEKYKVCNLVAPLFPKELAFYMGKEGYFAQGYTPLDALRTYLNEDFQVLTEANPIVNCGTWYEAWLPAMDMVCALPPCVGSKLQREDLPNIHQRPGKGLCIGTTPLVYIGGLKGVCNSVYDLRSAL